MEKQETTLIKNRISDLITNTNCTTELRNFFHQKSILSSDECDQIACKETRRDKADEFYKIIQTKRNAFPVLLEGLAACCQSGAEAILKGAAFLPPPPEGICFDVFPPVISFIGRTDELEQLHQMVLRSQGAERIAVVSQVTSVSGLGGIGKTQLAKEYVRLNKIEFNRNVLWMNAESEESLTASFQRLAEEKLNLPTKNGDGREMSAMSIAEAVYKYFEGGKALFVFDNAEKAAWLKQFMPKVGQTPTLFVLITSREREWDRGMEVLQLDGLTEKDAVKLIQQELGIETNDTALLDDIKKLAQTLQCFPLALQQAIAYIYEQQITLKYSIKDYLKEFASKQHQLLAFQEDQLCNESFTSTTTTTWSITFDKIKEDLTNGQLASLILNVVAYLGADNIKRNLFYLIPSIQKDSKPASVTVEHINGAVRLLVKYSMLNGRESQSILSVHRLVQSVTRHKLAQEGLDVYFLELAIELLQGSDDKDFPAENIAHVLISWRHASTHHQIIQGYAWQVNRILWKMMDAGHHDEGLRFGNEALEKFKEVFGEDHLNCLIIQRSIGLILREQGYIDKAVSVFQDVLSKAKFTYDENSEIYLLTNEALGNTLKQSGKNQEALKILKGVLEQKKTIFGDSHSAALTTETNYGLALIESGNLTEAEKLFQKIIEMYIKRGDENSTKVLHLQSSLTIIYSRKGENEKALEIRREVYEKLSPVWTENVDFFAAFCSNLGASLNEVGKHEEALQILEGNIEKIKKRLGSHHARTVEIQQEVGRSYQGLGNLSKAHEILQSVYEAFVSLSGEDSLQSLDASEDIAITLSLLGEHSQALSKFLENLSKMEALFGKENWQLNNTKWNFALAIERSAENLHTALELLKQAKAALIPIVGEDSPIVEDITNDIKRIEKKTKTS